MLVASGDDSNDWGVLVIFLLCGFFWKAYKVVGEFDVMESNFGSGLCGKGTVEAFNEKNVRPEAGWACAWGGKANARE